MTSTPGISSFQVEPKILSGSVTLRWELTADMLRLQVKVFTSSFRMLKRFPMDIKKTPELFKTGTHEIIWDGLDDRGQHLISGRYYLFLSANKGKLSFSAEDQVNQP
jgi:flagellar hook assembly protein FlgD